MTKAFLGATAAIALTAFAFTGTAQAQCWWTKGYNLQCSYPSASGSSYYAPPPAYVPPAAYSPTWSGGYPNYIYPDTGTYPAYWVMQR
jgi:hypothetical protein